MGSRRLAKIEMMFNSDTFIIHSCALTQTDFLDH